MAPCQRFAQDLSDYTDNELDKISKGRLEEHLGRCPDCAKYLKHLQVLKSYLRELSPIKPTQDFVPILRDRLRQIQQGKSRPQYAFFLPGHRLVPVLGVGALSVLVAFFLVDQSPKSSPLPAQAAIQEIKTVAFSSSAPVPEADSHVTRGEEQQSGFMAQAAESDTLAQVDSTSSVRDLDAVRSKIRTVNY
jgi:anti-sigma factor RsiW